MQVLEFVTPVPAMLLRFAAKWDMPQLRSFCEGITAIWEVQRFVTIILAEYQLHCT